MSAGFDAVNTLMPGVGLLTGVVVLGSKGPEFKSCFAVELIPGGVDSACHPSEVGKMSASMLVVVLINWCGVDKLVWC